MSGWAPGWLAWLVVSGDGRACAEHRPECSRAAGGFSPRFLRPTMAAEQAPEAAPWVAYVLPAGDAGTLAVASAAAAVRV